MYLESKEVIDRPLEEVYVLVRDDLAKLVPYLPNVDRIEVKKHAPNNGNGTEVINHWYAKVEALPGLVKKFIPPDIFSWKDMAKWNNEGHFVEYELESFLANDLFDAKGKNSFTSVGDNQTELKITCNVEIYPEKVPGVPKLLAKKVTPLIEGVVKKILGPNLTSLGDGLNKYFEEKQ